MCSMSGATGTTATELQRKHWSGMHSYCTLQSDSSGWIVKTASQLASNSGLSLALNSLEAMESIKSW